MGCSTSSKNRKNIIDNNNTNDFDAFKSGRKNSHSVPNKSNHTKTKSHNINYDNSLDSNKDNTSRKTNNKKVYPKAISRKEYQNNNNNNNNNLNKNKTASNKSNYHECSNSTTNHDDDEYSNMRIGRVENKEQSIDINKVFGKKANSGERKKSGPMLILDRFEQMFMKEKYNNNINNNNSSNNE